MQPLHNSVAVVMQKVQFLASQHNAWSYMTVKNVSVYTKNVIIRMKSRANFNQKFQGTKKHSFED